MPTEILTALVSGGGIVLGTYFWMKGDFLITNGRKANATIYANRYHYKPTSNKVGVYFPVVRFLTKEKEWITKQLEVGFNPPLKEGSKIKIIYDPEDPEYLQIENSLMLEIVPRILVAGGLIGLLLSLLSYLGYV